MVLLAALSALISLACALVIAWDARHRPRPDKVAWTVAFAVFALAAGVEVVGSTLGWTPTLARLYYLAGATLVVGYLALGELYLLAPRRIAAVAPGATLLVTAFAAALVFDAPVDRARLAADGWDAIERGPALKTLAIGINTLGTLILVGGALFSAWRFWRRGIHRQRMIGCLLIAGGTLVVASGGTLTRLGYEGALYGAMAAGVAVIFAGYLQTRRPEPTGRAVVPQTDGTEDVATPSPTPALAFAPAPDPTSPPHGWGRLVPLPTFRGGARRRIAPVVSPVDGDEDPAVTFLEARFLSLDDAALEAACRVWSVDRRPVDRFARDEARRVWALRLRLSPAGQAALDAHAVPAQLQLAELYHDVLAPGVAAWAEERRTVQRR